MPKMLEHEHIYLYLDNDASGQKCSQQALEFDKEKFIDESALYKNYKDLNNWLVKKAQRKISWICNLMDFFLASFLKNGFLYLHNQNDEGALRKDRRQ